MLWTMVKSCHCTLTFLLLRSVKRRIALFWMFAKTGSTVPIRRL